MRSHFPKEMFRYRLEIMPCLSLKIGDLVSKEMKQVTTLNQFKAKIKTLEVRKLSLAQNLPSTDRIHYIMSFNADKCRSIKS